MSALENKPTIPEGLDLGDVTNAPIGTLIAVLHTHKTGKPTVEPKLFVVEKDDGWRLLLRLETGDRTIGAIVKARGGASPYFMTNQFFYYSANPIHIQLARRKIETSERRVAKRRAVHEAQLAIARPIGEFLGDGEAYDGDGEPYQSRAVAQTLADHLTKEQMRQLAEWLGVEVPK